MTETSNERPIPTIDAGKLQYDKRPVIYLGQGAHEFMLPGRMTYLARSAVEQAGATVLFGERRAGFGSFLRWWREQAKAVGQEVIIVSAWDPADIRGVGDLQHVSELRSLIGRIVRSPEADDALALASDLARKATEDGRIVHFIVHHLDAMARQKAEKLSTLLRTLYERREEYHGGRFRMTVTVSSAEVITDEATHSGFLTVSQLYRLASFAREEIRLLGAQPSISAGPPITLDDDEIDRILDFTGGQPLLANTYLQRLREAGSGEAGSEERFEQAERYLRRAPPEIASTWRQHLLELLQRDRRLEEPLSYYVRDQRISPTMKNRYPPPDHERELFISGWVSLDRRERWGIRSPLHRDWARLALDRFQRGER